MDLGSPWYPRIFPHTRISRDKDTEIETVFTAGGFRLGTSTTGTLTRRGGDLVICDDPIKAQDVGSETKRETNNELFRKTFLSRLDNQQTGAIVVVMQRLHANDFVGSLLAASDGWTVLSLPAIAERDEHIQIGENEYYFRKAGEPLHAEREPLSVLHRVRDEMGPDAWAAQYQQDPVPAGGLIIKRDWIKYHNITTLEPNRRHRIIQSWDTAGKAGPRNSYSVCTTWLLENGNYYLLDLNRGRFDFDMLESTAVNYAQKYKPFRILIEDASTGVALAAHLRKVWPLCRGTRPCSSRQNYSAVCPAGQIRVRPSPSARRRGFSPAAFEGAFVVSAIENHRSGRQHQPSPCLQGIHLHARQPQVGPLTSSCSPRPSPSPSRDQRQGA